MPVARTTSWGTFVAILMLAGCQGVPLPPSGSDGEGGADTRLVADAAAVPDSSTAEMERSTGGATGAPDASGTRGADAGGTGGADAGGTGGADAGGTGGADGSGGRDAAPDVRPASGECFGTVGADPIERGCLGAVRQWSTTTEGTCAVLETGGVRCWGGDGCTGVLGEGIAIQWRLRPGPEVLAGARQVSRSRHACAVLESGGLRCWGPNNAGQLGEGTVSEEPRRSPSNSDVLAGVEAVATGAHHTCALMKTGGVRCWGLNNTGQLGDGTHISRSTPPTTDVISDVRAISVGLFTTCVLRNNGGVRCWGSNVDGQLGDGTTTPRNRPPDTDVITGVRAVATSGAYTCAVLETGGLRCWGKLNHGPTITSPPTTDLLTAVTAVAPGHLHACAILGEGDLRCWGANGNGQLGTGERSLSGSDTPVGSVSGVLGVTVGLSHTCAKMATGLYCWGSNGYGNLGNGIIAAERYQPTRVLGLCP